VLLILTRGEAAGVERDDGVAEVAETCLTLGNQLRIKGAGAVTRSFDFDCAEIAANGLGAGAAARVAGEATFDGVFGVAEVLLHFELKERFESVFDEALEDALGVDRAGAAAGAHLVHQLFLECLAVVQGFAWSLLYGFGW
jgi:hypothetical protein